MNVIIAASAWSRLRGLLARPMSYLGDEGALLLVPCSSIHTFGMDYPIDVAFIGGDGTVLKEERGLRPRRFLSCRNAIAVLERPSGAKEEPVLSRSEDSSWFHVGDKVTLGKAVRDRKLQSV